MRSSNNSLKSKKMSPVKATTPSFVCEIALATHSDTEKKLNSSFEASRQLYNACLSEAKRRLMLVRDSRAYQKARILKKSDPQRKKLFKQAKDQYSFNEYSLHSYAGKVKNSWIGGHLGIHLAQKLATRAFSATEKLLYGKAKGVRFKTKNQLDSIEGKNNQTALIWKETLLKFGELSIEGLIDSRDPVTSYALSKRVKYCRLVRRRIRERVFYFVQLVCEGVPLSLKDRKMLKIQSGEVTVPLESGTVGLDVGPSTVAIVSEETASLHQFCDELKDQQKEQRKLQRKQDRQRRANNPRNYKKNGTIKAGPKKWIHSSRQEETRRKVAECSRTSAAHRKSLHGKLINQNIALDSEIRIEKLSYRSFQKNFGKSVGNRAPGMFIERLKRKAENACGSVVEFSTFQTRLSQTCICGRIKKKALSQRIHECQCGVSAQRDLFSAYLARFVQEDRLDVSAAQESWTGAETLLRTAFEWKCQTASRGTRPSSFGISKKVFEKSGSSAKERATCMRRKPDDKTWDAVKAGVEPVMRAQESQMEVSFRTRQL